VAHAHTRTTRAREGSRSRRGWIIAITVGVVAVVGVGFAAVAVHSNSPKASAAPTSAPGRELASTSDVGPLKVVSVSPGNGNTDVPSDATISVQFSVRIKAGSPTPGLSPAVSGSWQLVTPDTYSFVASAPFVPATTETVLVPAGDGGVVSTTGKVLAQPVEARFTVAQGNTLRLQQLLAQLGYLPVSFTPAGPLVAPQEAAQAQEGTFAWKANEPASLVSLWTVGSTNQIVKGAVMAFESQHNLRTDGLAGATVWQDLLADAASGTMDPNPYNYVFVSETLPETATVYSNGAEVYSTLANTGVGADATQTGTFPVFERFKVTTMTGTNLDGSHYVDPGIPWVSYFNGGDALHGYVRSSYGFPQSDGCVEMPPSHAEVVFPLTPIGTLVTVAA